MAATLQESDHRLRRLVYRGLQRCERLSYTLRCWGTQRIRLLMRCVLPYQPAGHLHGDTLVVTAAIPRRGSACEGCGRFDANLCALPTTAPRRGAARRRRVGTHLVLQSGPGALPQGLPDASPQENPCLPHLALCGRLAPHAEARAAAAMRRIPCLAARVAAARPQRRQDEVLSLGETQGVAVQYAETW